MAELPEIGTALAVELDGEGIKVDWVCAQVQGAMLPVDGGLTTRGYYAEHPGSGDVPVPREDLSDVAGPPASPLP